MNLIDRDSLIESGEVLTVHTREYGTIEVIPVENIIEAPTVDAVPVVHGEWIYHECVSSYDGTESGYSCSRCCAFVTEETFDMDYFHKEFCGHCGAKMDGWNTQK